MKKYIKRIKKKNTRSGFSLAETLIAVLILLMVSAVVATGIPAASNAYQKVVDASNAEVLLSTAINTLRNELGTATKVTVNEEGTSISYFSVERKSPSKIYLAADGADAADSPQMIMFQRYAAYDESILTQTEKQKFEEDATRLVSQAAATQNFYVTFDSVTKENGVIRINGLGVYRNKEKITSLKDSSGADMALAIRTI